MAEQSGTVNLINPSGSLVGMPSEDAGEALAAGYRMAHPEEVAQHFEKEEYTSGAKPILAAGAGFLRGGSLGLSDVALTKSGLVKPDTLKKLEEYNPAESMTGEGLAIGASMLAPGLGEATTASGMARAAARGLTAPLRGVSAVGRSAMGAAEALLPAGAGALGRTASMAAAHAVGGGLEGAAFGAGRALSEHSMGDPEALGEKLMGHIGFSAMIGGGIGGTIGSMAGLSKEAYGALKKSFPDVPSPNEVLASVGVDTLPGYPKTSLGDAVGIADKTPAEQKSFFGGLAKRSENANDVEAVAQKHGLPVLEEMLTKDEPLLKTAEALRDSDTPIGQARVRELQKGWDYWKDKFYGLLGEGSDVSQKELGDSVASRLADRITEGQSEFTGRFSKIKDIQKDIQIPDESRVGFFKKMQNSFENTEKVTEENALLMKNAANKVIKMNTGEGVMTAIGEIKDDARAFWRAGQAGKGTALDHVAKSAEDMLHEETIKTAEAIEMSSLQKTGEIMAPVGDGQSLVAEYKQALADYAVFKKEQASLARNLGLGENKQAYQIKQALAKKNPQQIMKMLFNNNNVRTAEFFQKYAPDIMADVKAFQRGEMREAATKGIGMPLNPKELVRHYYGLEKELQNILFSGDEKMLLKEGATYLNAFPKKFNGSGTASGLNYMGMGKMFNIFNGEMAASWGKLAKDAYSSQKLRAAGLKSEDLAHASWLAKAVDKSNQRIASSAKAVFKFGDKAELPTTGFVASKAAEKLLSHDDQKKMIAEINELKNNPEKFIEKLDNSTKPIFKIAPGTATAAHAATVRAVQYLAAAAPVVKSPYPLGEDFPISKTEMNIFAERLHVVNNPEVVMDELKNGTLTAAHVEAVSQVYPRLHQEMQMAVMTELTNAISKKQAIPYKTKNMLSLFLNQDLDSSITAPHVMANQVMLGKSQMQSQQADNMMMGKTTQGGLGKLKMSSNLQTAMQQSSQRGNKA